MQTSYFKLASLLTKVKLSNDEKIHVKNALENLCDKIEVQKQFFEYCKKWKLAPWVNTQLKKLDRFTLFSESVQDFFSTTHQQIKHTNEVRNKEATKFLKAFRKNNIDVVILKGNLFIHTIYKDSGYKRMNDFDMLIHQEDWPKVQEIYFKLGYIPLGFGWSGEKQDVAKFSHAGMSFISPDYRCITGTQWGLKSPTSKYTIDARDLWENTQDFDFYGLQVKQLSPEYNLLHLILHMGVYKCGIRDCMDVYNLFLADKGINEEQFTELAKKTNALDKSYFTLMLSNLCSDAVPVSLLEKIKPQRSSYLTRRLNSRLKIADKTGDMQHSYNDYFHNVEMSVFYFNLFPVFHKRVVIYLKLWLLLLWPKSEITYKLADITQNASFFVKVKARLKAPYYVFALLTEEIGLTINFLLLFKFFIDTFLSIKNYFVKKDSYFDYLRKRGIDPKEIKREVKKIQ